jgi:hypothetical protein
MEEIKTRLSTDLRQALKNKDNIATKTIRSLMSAIDNAEAIAIETPSIMPMAGLIAGATEGLGSTEVMRKELTGQDIQEIIKKEIDEIQNAIDLMKDYKRPETKDLEKQIDVLKKYL